MNEEEKSWVKKFEELATEIVDQLERLNCPPATGLVVGMIVTLSGERFIDLNPMAGMEFIRIIETATKDLRKRMGAER